MHTDWISTAEATKLSGYNLEYIRRLIRNKKIKATRKGHDYWIDRASFLEYFQTTKARSEKDKRHGPRPKELQN